MLTIDSQYVQAEPPGQAPTIPTPIALSVEGFTHEARAPVATIRDYLELLRSRTELDDRQRTYVVRALEEVYHLESLFECWHQASVANGRASGAQPGASGSTSHE